MPLPGESITEIYKILEDASAMMCIPASARRKDDAGALIDKAKKLLNDEEMEIIRFGDLTRLADHTYEPYQTIKKASEILDKHSNWVGAQKALEIIGARIKYSVAFPVHQSTIFN